MKLQYAVSTTSGVIRTVNEDNFYLNGITKSMTSANYSASGRCDHTEQLFAVCDGLGGEGSGEHASYLSVSALKDFQVSFSDAYAAYIEYVNTEICAKHTQQVKMGCTVAALAFNDVHGTALNIGDSRIYCFDSHGIRQVSQDHTEFATMVKYGVLKAEDYYTSKTRNHLTRSLGTTELAEPYVRKDLHCEKDDLYLICSDGLCGTLSNTELLEICTSEGSLRHRCNQLIKQALAKGSDDNITALLIYVETV